jgi:hypothetical protein
VSQKFEFPTEWAMCPDDGEDGSVQPLTEEDRTVTNPGPQLAVANPKRGEHVPGLAAAGRSSGFDTGSGARKSFNSKVFPMQPR